MSTQTATIEETEHQTDTPWAVLLWDDPVNDMAYVSYVLAQVFQYNSKKASQIMLEAHTNGKARAWSGERHDAEAKVAELHQWKLQATLERA